MKYVFVYEEVEAMKQTDEYLPSIPLSTFEVAVPENAEADAKAKARVEEIMRELEESMNEEKVREVEAELKALESLDHVDIEEIEKNVVDEIPEEDYENPANKISRLVPELELEDDVPARDQVESDANGQSVVHRADVALEQKQELASDVVLSVEIPDVAIETVEQFDTMDSEQDDIDPTEDLMLDANHQKRLKVNEDEIAPLASPAPLVQDKPQGFFDSIGSTFARLFHLDR
jgi:hypothetical protein